MIPVITLLNSNSDLTAGKNGSSNMIGVCNNGLRSVIYPRDLLDIVSTILQKEILFHFLKFLLYCTPCPF